MTNILKPKVVWIDGRCYRTDDPGRPSQSQHFENYPIKKEITKNVEVPDDEILVTMVDTRFKTSFHVASNYHTDIIGKKGETKIHIERDTKTEILIPSPGCTGDILVFGPNETSVKIAWKRINQIVISSRLRQKPTHFISIPMNSPQIMANYLKFKESTLHHITSRGLDETLFIGSHKLHITFGIICLKDAEETSRVTELFTEAKDTIVMPILKDHLPLRIRLKGLHYMRNTPQQMNVLYAKVQEEGSSGVLQVLADTLVKYFSRKGFMKENEFGNKHVNLHVTLLNTKYKRKFLEKQKAIKKDSSERKAITFDGRKIIEQFGDYDFGVAEVADIHLSQMCKSSPDEYYNATCVIHLN